MYLQYAWHATKQSLCEEIKHVSRFDATRDNWRFEAENLKRITIYQLMKPLKIIPHPLRPLFSEQYYSQVLHAIRGAVLAKVTIH